MEFLASLAIKAFIGTSICGAVTVGTIYKCDKTLLGFKDNQGDKNSAREEEGQDQGDSSQTKEVGENSLKDAVKSGLTSNVGDDYSIPEAGVDTSEGDTNSSGISQEEPSSPEVKLSTPVLVPVVPVEDEQPIPAVNPDTMSVTVSDPKPETSVGVQTSQVAPETSPNSSSSTTADTAVGSSPVVLTTNTNPQDTQ